MIRMSDSLVIDSKDPFEGKVSNENDPIIETGTTDLESASHDNSTLGTPLSQFSGINDPEFSNAVPMMYLSEIEELENVTTVYYSRNVGEKEVEFWVVIETEDFNTREEIFSREAELQKMFKQYEFTSHVIAKELDDHLSMVPDRANEIYTCDGKINLTHAESVGP